MTASCIALAAAGILHLIPAAGLTLSWDHSVEHARWEEDYVLQGDSLIIREARIRTSGAGMDAPEDAVFDGAWWRYQPRLAPFRSVTLANSEFVAGYQVCWGTACRRLDVLLPKGEPVTLGVQACRKETLND